MCDVWSVPLVPDYKYCGLAHSDEWVNWIQTSSHHNGRIPFNIWLVLSDDVAGFKCAWPSSVWYCNWEAWWRGIVFCIEDFDACYLDSRQRSSIECGALDNTDCQTTDNKEVVRIETSQWITTLLDTEGGCTPHCSPVDGRRAKKSGDPIGEIDSTGCFSSMEDA